MNTQPTYPSQRFSHALTTLIKYKLLWIIPAIIGMLLACAYVFLIRAETWSARQSLIVRDDLLGQSYKPGRFDSLDSMKTAQETILEISRRPQVIRNALEKLGPESNGFLGMGKSNWPSEEVIEVVQGAISFSAPNGAEFGTTEVIVLNTRASSRERVRAFTEVLLEEIIAKTNDVRISRLQSMQAELTEARDGAKLALSEVSEKLKMMDEELGPDIGAMDSLVSEVSNDDGLRREVSQIESEKRRVKTELSKAMEVLAMLQNIGTESEELFKTNVMKYQPALGTLNSALVTAKQQLALNLGRYTKQHPNYISARNSVDEIREQIGNEREAMVATLSLEVSTKTKELERLNGELEKLDSRLGKLSSRRAESYSLRASVGKRIEILNNAESELAEIQGLAMGAKSANLLTPVDEAQVSTRPDGLGKKAVIIAGTIGGLMLGLGLVLLIAPPSDSEHTPTPTRSARSQTQSRSQTRSQSQSQSQSQAQSQSQSQSQVPNSLGDTLRNLVGPVLPKVEQSIGSMKSALRGKTQKTEAEPATPVPSPSPVASPTATNSVSINPTGVQQKSTEELVAQALATQKAKNQAASLGGASSAAALVDQAFASDTDAPSKPVLPKMPIRENAPTIETSAPLAESVSKEELGIDTNKLAAEMKRRNPNVRPVDLAKSTDESASSFVRVEPKSDQTSTGDKVPYENPFLKNPAVSKKSEQAPEATASASDDLKQIEESLKQSAMANDEAVIPVPDQIRKLSNTIANFAAPIKRKNPDGV